MTFTVPVSRRMFVHEVSVREVVLRKRVCGHCSSYVFLNSGIRNARCNVCGKLICGLCAKGETEDPTCCANSKH